MTARLSAMTMATAVAFAPVGGWAAPPEGCTAGPAEAIRAGDLDEAKRTLRAALADTACGAVAPELRIRLAYVLAEAHGDEIGPACEAMGLFRRAAAESDDPLVQSDAGARADKLARVCAGEVPPKPAEGDAIETPSPADAGNAQTEPREPPPPGVEGIDAARPEPTTRDWIMVGTTGGLLLTGGLIVGASMMKLETRNQARVDYVAAPFGSAAEQDAADRFHDAQDTAQVLLGVGVAVLAIGAASGIVTVGLWPDESDGSSEDGAGVQAELQIGPGGLGVVGRW